MLVPISAYTDMHMHACSWLLPARYMYRFFNTSKCTRLRLPVSSLSGALRTKSASRAGDSFQKEFLTLEKSHSCETEVKKSKFIAIAWPISGTKQALELIEANKDLSASHNCFAYKLGDEFRFSDDGEPGGTAGRPIFSSIEGEGLDGVCVMVTRFFGGTLLGAGGLVRAYGGAARACLKEAEKMVFEPHTTLKVQVPFERIGIVYQLADQHGLKRLDEDYSDSGGLTLHLSAKAKCVDHFNSALLDATSGHVKAKEL